MIFLEHEECPKKKDVAEDEKRIKDPKIRSKLSREYMIKISNIIYERVKLKLEPNPKKFLINGELTHKSMSHPTTRSWSRKLVLTWIQHCS